MLPRKEKFSLNLGKPNNTCRCWNHGLSALEDVCFFSFLLVEGMIFVLNPDPTSLNF